MPSPDSIDATNIRLWLRPEEVEADYTDGETVTTWRDASGNLHNFSGLAQTSPSRVANMANGLSLVRFGHWNQRLDNSDAALQYNPTNDDFTVAALVYVDEDEGPPEDPGKNWKGILTWPENSSEIDGTVYPYTYHIGLAGNRVQLVFRGDNYYGGIIGLSRRLLLVIYTHDSATAANRLLHHGLFNHTIGGANEIDGKNDDDVTAGTRTVSSEPSVILGERSRAGNPDQFQVSENPSDNQDTSHGDFLEVAVWDAALSSMDRQDLIDYFVAKYAPASTGDGHLDIDSRQTGNYLSEHDFQAWDSGAANVLDGTELQLIGNKDAPNRHIGPVNFTGNLTAEDVALGLGHVTFQTALTESPLLVARLKLPSTEAEYKEYTSGAIASRVGIVLALRQDVDGPHLVVYESLGTEGVNDIARAPFRWTADQAYRVLFNVSGTNVQAMIWPKGQPKPVKEVGGTWVEDWMIDEGGLTITDEGYIGLGVYGNGLVKYAVDPDAPGFTEGPLHWTHDSLTTQMPPDPVNTPEDFYAIRAGQSLAADKTDLLFLWSRAETSSTVTYDLEWRERGSDTATQVTGIANGTYDPTGDFPVGSEPDVPTDYIGYYLDGLDQRTYYEARVRSVISGQESPWTGWVPMATAYLGETPVWRFDKPIPPNTGGLKSLLPKSLQ